jgi:hypothetical protein
MKVHRRLRVKIAGTQPFQGAIAFEAPQEIIIGKTAVSREGDAPGVLVEVFTMTLGAETIELLPLKNWMQLDIHKWRARGLLPRTPTGLEITWDKVKVAGETVSPWDPEACSKLEKAFNEWLAVENRNREAAKEKAQAPLAQIATSQRCDEEAVHFEVDMSNPELPKIKCLEGNETVKVVALNLQGINALIEQGFMRKPTGLKVGALHDWVELDSHLFRFKDSPNEANELQKVLNGRYLLASDPDATPDVVVFQNPASPTGFDIQFPATPQGLVENRKHHLNEETIHLLQDPERCWVLRKGITARLAAPDLIFKLKTAGGGERYLDAGPPSTVCVETEDGQTKRIELSQPVSLLNLGVRELTAVFNHPAINRRAYLAEAARSKHKSA